MSKSFPSNDLTFYENDCIFINKSQSKTLTLVTQTLETCSTWLVDLVTSKILSEPCNSVIVVQFINKTLLHQRGIKRYGVEVDTSCKSGSLKLIDVSDKLFKVGINSFQSLDITELQNFIMKSVVGNQSVKNKDQARVDPASCHIILENIDILLTAGSSAEKILNLIHNLQSISAHIQIICNADSPLVTPGSNLSSNHGLLINHLIHRSSLVVSLRPLETGRADDVTGVFRITRGPKLSPLQVVENEYLYFVTSDNVRIIHR